MPIPISPRSSRRRRAMTLAIVMVFGVLVIGLSTGIVLVAKQQTTERARYETYKDEFAACEAALNKAYAQMQFLKSYHAADFEDQMAAIQPPIIRDAAHTPPEYWYEFTQFSAVKIFEGRESIATGRWKGLSLNRLRYQITVTALKHGNTADRIQHGGVTLRETVELTYIPLYLFAIFYDPMMEIAPGAAMTVNGRVHANHDAYIMSLNGLDFRAPVTVAGNVYHGRAPNSGQSNSDAEVRFTNDANQLLSMKRSTGDSDGWLTHTDEDWASAATSRWGNGLADSAQGVHPLSLPLPDTIDSHDVIERSDSDDPQSLKDEKFENKAGLKIVVQSNGTIKGYNAAGTEVSLSYKSGGKTYYVAAMTTFYDAREGKTVNSVDVDLSKLIASGKSPSNGIVYVANEKSGNNMDAVRLVNGSTLPSSTSGGFTVASENPVYVKGNYNTNSQKLAMIAADAITILSNAWNDANSGGPKSGRNANATTVNSVCMQGIVSTGNNHYSGGVENYFRLLENWSGIEYKFSGSIINMWESEIATGVWNNNDYYNPPNRNWSWDTSLGGAAGPPGAPSVIEIRRTGWEMPPN